MHAKHLFMNVKTGDTSENLSVRCDDDTEIVVKETLWGGLEGHSSALGHTCWEVLE
jgi:hypothetical protein